MQSRANIPTFNQLLYCDFLVNTKHQINPIGSPLNTVTSLNLYDNGVFLNRLVAKDL